MEMKLPMHAFDAEEIKIRNIFRSESLDRFSCTPVPSEKIRHVYGEELMFTDVYPDRPYIFASFVASIDGKLAYADKPSAFYVAGKNKMAGGGKTADFWILNMLRGVCDGAVIGGNSLRTDPDYSMYCMDEDIMADRIRSGLPAVPLNIVMTLDASDVPLDHMMLKNETAPCLMITSPAGADLVKEEFRGAYEIISGDESEEMFKEKLSRAGQGILPVLVTGSGRFPDSHRAMKLLKASGVSRLLIESPGYGHYLIRQSMMDELFLNLSAVYIGGGDTMTLGKADKGFSAESHPHARILSIHLFNEYFAYFRYKLDYRFVE